MSDNISIVVTSNTSSIAVTAPAGAGATINTGVISAPPTTNASDLTSGTLPDARLSAAVPILVSGLIPSGLLPSYVDDVVEYANLAGFPATGEAGKIFVDIATKKIYRWSGSVYVEINAAPVQSVSGRTGTVTLTSADVGLGSVNNVSDESKPVSTATQTALNLKASLTSPTFAGTVGGITKAMVGLGSADNVSDESKPVSTATQNALDAKAPLLSPALTGVPTAITATADTSSTQLATCGFVLGQASSSNPSMDGGVSVGNSLRYARQDHIHPSDTSRASINAPTFTGVVTIPSGANIAGYALTSSPSFTGSPLATTASADENSTRIATCAFVAGQAASATPVVDGTAAVGSSLRYARQDHVHPTNTSLATLNSPALTGTPTAPTASAATNTTQIATTAFVRAEVSALVGSATSTLDTLGELAAALGSDASFSTTIATSLGYKAPIESPTFTGTVTIPSGASISGFAPIDSPTFTTAAYSVTASADDTSTTVATCAFVMGQAGSNNPTMDSSASVGTSLRYSREDHTHPSDTSLAPLASPTFTGTVTIPSGASISGFAPIDSPTFTTAAYSVTASADDTSTKVATCQFVTSQAGSNNPTMNSNAGVGTSLRYSREDHTHPTDTGRAASSHAHGNITNAGAIGATDGLPIITTASGVLTTGAFGSTSGTFAQGNDTRFPSSASTSTAGIVRLADVANTLGRTDNSLAITPFGLGLSTRGGGRAKFWEAFTDFNFDFSGNVTGSDGFSFGTYFIGTGASLDLYANKPATFSSQPTSGIATLTTGTTATGSSSFYSWNSPMPRFDNGARVYETLIYIPVLSTAVEEYLIRIGNVIGGPIGGAAIMVAFEYNRLNSVNWMAVTANNGTFTRTDTGVAATAATWTKLAFSGNSASIAFSIDGSVVATNTTNIRADGDMKLGGNILKSAGTTARTFLVDYVYTRHDFTGSR